MNNHVSDKVMSAVHGLEAQHSESVVMLVSAEGVFLYMSPQALVTDGFHPEEKIGKSFQEFVHPDDVELVYASMQGALIADNAPAVKLRVLNRNGGYQVVNSLAKRLIDAESGEFYVVRVGTRA